MKKLMLLTISMLSSLIIVSCCNPAHAYDPSTFIPPKAFKYKDIITTEITNNFKEIPEVNYVPSLIEHESCISLTHRRCWEPTSQLKTAREEGAGFGQQTRAYNKDGSIRFDSLKEIRDRHKYELKELTWSNIYQRPDLQIRTITLMLKDMYKQLYTIPNEIVRLQMTDASYNGGAGGLLKERRACSLSNNCNPNIWFNNVENKCLKSKKVLYGDRSACDINRYHVVDVFNNKIPKYKKLYFSNNLTKPLEKKL